MNSLATLRYLVFAALIVFSSIVASVAVWNSSLVSSSGQEAHIDTYLVIVGALGLALTFTIIFVELIRRNAFTSRVWFELLWTTTFFMLYLGGASVLTALGPDTMCQPQLNARKINPFPQEAALPPGFWLALLGCAPFSSSFIWFCWSCSFASTDTMNRREYGNAPCTISRP